ncbi:MAG: RNA polymerase factor sigma-54, partial [Bacteroidota bacterium]
MLKQQFRQKLLQKLTPQQIQVIKLLEIPTYQLEQKIKKEMEENPVLEEGKDEFDEPEENTTEETSTEEEEFSVEDYMQDDDDTPYYKLQSRNQSSDNYKKEEIPFSVGISYHEHLRNQLGMRMLEDHEYQIAEYLIGNIDDDGYLRREMEAIVDDLAFNENIETSREEVTRVLVDIVQSLDPPGSGARNLQECLILQLNSKKEQRSAVDLAIKVLEEHFEAFTRKHYDKIISQMNISEDELKEVINEITHLYPKPGSSYSDSDSKVLEHIVPDFVLENRDGQLILSLNSRNVPDLRLSRTYVDMLESSVGKNKNGVKRNKETVSFVKQKINSAKWFIDAVKQRQTTLMLTMDAILNFK